jgi:hypothetical protein
MNEEIEALRVPKSVRCVSLRSELIASMRHHRRSPSIPMKIPSPSAYLQDPYITHRDNYLPYSPRRRLYHIHCSSLYHCWISLSACVAYFPASPNKFELGNMGHSFGKTARMMGGRAMVSPESYLHPALFQWPPNSFGKTHSLTCLFLKTAQRRYSISQTTFTASNFKDITNAPCLKVSAPHIQALRRGFPKSYIFLNHRPSPGITNRGQLSKR